MKDYEFPEIVQIIIGVLLFGLIIWGVQSSTTDTSCPPETANYTEPC